MKLWDCAMLRTSIGEINNIGTEKGIRQKWRESCTKGYDDDESHNLVYFSRAAIVCLRSPLLSIDKWQLSVLWYTLFSYGSHLCLSWIKRCLEVDWLKHAYKQTNAEEIATPTIPSYFNEVITSYRKMMPLTVDAFNFSTIFSFEGKKSINISIFIIWIFHIEYSTFSFLQFKM